MNPSNTKVYYLASPYSHSSKSVQENRRMFITQVAAKLKTQHDLTLICPITQSAEIVKYMPEPDSSGKFSTWQKDDLLFIDISHGVIVCLMEGWHKSVGVTAEINHARANNKDIFYYCPHREEFYTVEEFHKIKNKFIKD
jgi:hypothetical protein